VTLQAVLLPNLQTSPLQGNGDNEPECVMVPSHTLKTRRRGPAHVWRVLQSFAMQGPWTLLSRLRRNGDAGFAKADARRGPHEVRGALQDDSHSAAPTWSTESPFPSPIERKFWAAFDAPYNKSSQRHSEASRSFQRHRRSLSASRSSTSRRMSR